MKRFANDPRRTSKPLIQMNLLSRTWMKFQRYDFNKRGAADIKAEDCSFVGGEVTNKENIFKTLIWMEDKKSARQRSGDVIPNSKATQITQAK